MTVYALDPGSEQSALVAFDGRTIHFKRILPNDNLLALIRASGPALKGVRFVIERIGHYGSGMPAGNTVFQTCYFSGECCEAARAVGALVEYVSRPTVKTHLCGNPRAKDANVSQALRDKYPPEMLKGIAKDLWAALAVAHWAITSNPKQHDPEVVTAPKMPILLQ